MATVPQQQPPTGTTSQPLHQQQSQQQQQQQQKPPSDPNSASSTLSWDGDRMFHIYIYDYCYKRGFLKTAQELQSEAELAPDSQPPINAKQGLLFEWWSVFWVLFTTKSNGTGTEDAMLYTQHQTQQSLARQQRLPVGHLSFDAVGRPLAANGPQPGIVPGQPAPGQPGGPVGAQQPLRMANGIRPGGPPIPGGPTFLPNGSVPSGPLPNGAPTHGPPFTPGMRYGTVSPGLAGMNQSHFYAGAPGTGPRTNGAVVGGPPFQRSPTMANTPNGGHGGQPGQLGQPGPQSGGPQAPQHVPQQGGGMGQPPMNQMGPGPQGMGGGTMSRPGTSGGMGTPGNSGGSMLPPNGPGSGPPGGGPGQQVGMGQAPPYGRPPSRTNTPGAGMMVQQSPSLMNRPIPGTPGGMMAMGGMSPGHAGMNMNMMGGGATMNATAMMNLQNEINSIPPHYLKQYKAELNLPDRELNTLSDPDKMRLFNHHRMKMSRQQPNPGNAVAGPSNMRPNMPMPPGQQRPGPPNQQTPPQAGQRAGKRNGTSPGEDHGMLPGQTDNQSSPRSAKRPRHSPAPDQPMYPQQQQPGQQQQGMPGQQPGPGGTPVMNHPQPPMSMMRPNPGMGGSMMGQGPPILLAGSPMGGPGAPNSGMNGPPMGGMNGFAQGMNGPMPGMMMSPGLSHPQAGGMNNPMVQYRQNMQAMHNKVPGSANSPAAADSPFNPGVPGAPGSGPPRFVPSGPPGQGPGPQQQQQQQQQNAQAANKPIMHSMPPPPSPSMKDQNVGGKDGNGAKPGSGPGGGSPQNQGMGGQTPNTSGGTAPPTPGPGPGPMNPGPMNPGPPPSSTPNPSNPMTAPSPSGMMGNPPMNTGPPPPSAGLGSGAMGADLFSTDFINSVASTLDDFDSSMFRPDGDINFERDFGQWFNGDDAMGGLS